MKVRNRKTLRQAALVANSFCPTGEGGGIDPSCSPNSQQFEIRGSIVDVHENPTKQGLTNWLKKVGTYGNLSGFMYKGSAYIFQNVNESGDTITHDDIEKAAGIKVPAKNRFYVGKGPDGSPRVASQSAEANEVDRWADKAGIVHNILVVNPFVSEAQRRACYAADDPNWDCHEWSQATKGRKLPQRKAKKKGRSVANLAAMWKRKRAGIVGNAVKSKLPNPLKLDPTRTITLRRHFETELKKRFAKLRFKIIQLVDKEDVFGLRERSHTVNVFCATGVGGGIDSSCSPDGSNSEIVKSFVSEWTSGKEGVDTGGQFSIVKPSDSVVKELSSARPSQAVFLYRSHREGSSHADYESWTTEKELASTITENEPGRVTLARRVDPSEMLFHADYLHKSLEEHSVSGEVVVAHGKAAKNIAAVRGEKLVRGQQGNGDIVKNIFCSTGVGGGVDSSCSPSDSSSNTSPDSHEAASTKASGILSKYSSKISALIDRVPVVGTVKRGTQKVMGAVKEKLAQRYGDKAAGIIMASGSVGGYGVMALAIRTVGFTVPGVTDLISIAGHVAVAEGLYQMGILKGRPKATTNEEWDGVWNESEELDYNSLAVEAWKEIAVGFAALTKKHKEELEEGLKDEVVDNNNPNHDELGRFAMDSGAVDKSGPEYNPVSMTRIDDKDNSLFIGLIRAYRPGDFQKHLTELESRAREEGLGALSGEVTGDARLRLFKRQGFEVVEELGHKETEKGLQPVYKIRKEIKPTTNAATSDWQFSTDPEKVSAFKEWLATQIQTTILGKTEKELWKKFTIAGFKKGAARAFDDTKKSPKWGPHEGDFYKGSKDQFLRSSFAQPVAVEKVQLLAARVYSDLEGVTDAMSVAMSRTLMDGLVQGKGPREIGRDLAEDVDDIGVARGTLIARTEIIRAHAEGQLTALEQLGVEEVGVEVEWSTTGDGKVCDECSSMEGVTFSLDEARGMIPAHPNCRCSWIPANVGEKDKEEKETIENISVSSVDREVKLLDAYLTGNAFCPTGKGGGIDPSCSKGGEASTGANLPPPPKFFSSDKANVAKNEKAIGEMRELAASGNWQALKAHEGTPSPKVQDYKKKLLSLQPKLTPVKATATDSSTLPVAAATQSTKTASSISTTLQKVSAGTGLSAGKIQSIASGSANPLTSKSNAESRAKITGEILNGGHAIKDAVLQVMSNHDVGANSVHVAAIAKGNVAAAQKEYETTPIHDLKVLSEIEVKGTQVQGQAVCNMVSRKLTMGTTSVTGDYRHELGHAVHSALMTDKTMDQAIKNEYTKVMAKVQADPVGLKTKLSHDEYETKYGAVGRRALDNDKENFAEHYRLYHREIYRDKNEGGNGKFLSQYRERHPGMAAIFDAHYTTALLGSK